MEKRKIKPAGYWTKEKCHEEALKYETRTEFYKSSTAYGCAKRNKWLDEICSHMIEIKKPNRYWTKEQCHEEALKYKTKVDFRKNSQSAYSTANKNKWLDEICSHMERLKSKSKRMIYAHEFSDNHVYIGLTGNIKIRNSQHKYRGPVNIHYKKTGLYPIIVKISDYIDGNEASELEGIIEQKYKDEGWITLNIAKTGGLGGSTVKWTYEKCQEEALKYMSKSEFQKKEAGAYTSAWKNGWLNDFCSHMVELHKPNGYWTYEKCQEEAFKYKTKSEFEKGSNSAYIISLRNGWIYKICNHMIDGKKPNGYWTKEKCYEEALNYQTKTMFSIKSPTAYGIIMKNNWEDSCLHMLEKRKINNYWTKEKCHEEALKYDTRSVFKTESTSAYSISCNNKWLDEICSHMIEIKKPNGYWNNKQKCKEESLKYKTKTEFQKKSKSAYKYSVKNKWLNEFFPKKIIK